MVHFVGAGPGAEDLITVRGMRLLQTADVIIYAGSLVNPMLLSYARKECRIYDSARLTLEEVIELMERADRQQWDVVRLHTGEPSIYGAVREQMDALDALGIAYDSCPGVSACFGAAASLNLEYTLPGLSQSLIITRMAGRTKVPEQESIERFAAHQATMAVYLSVGMIGELEMRLMAGGYAPHTPAALVYKATWQEEEAYLCTVDTLSQTAKEHHITKTALILVGDVIGKSGYARSQLYDPAFETGYRRAKAHRKPDKQISEADTGIRRLAVISFTERGEALADRVREVLLDSVECMLYTKRGSYDADSDENAGFGRSDVRKAQQRSENVKGEKQQPENAKKENQQPEMEQVTEPLRIWAAQQFDAGSAILFIGACGIAVRGIAACVKDKLTDVPVLVADEAGQFVIPLLSGHYGGANGLAKRLAERLMATAVTTTATDVNGLFAVDVFAKRNGLWIRNREGIARVSAKLLREGRITMSVSGAYTGNIPPEVTIVPYPPKDEVDVLIAPELTEDIRAKLFLVPRCIVLGMGCKKGKPEAEVEAFVRKTLDGLCIPMQAVAALASIDRKGEEGGFLDFSDKYEIPFQTYPAAELAAVEGEFLSSAFVEEQVGVDNVCGRAAMCAAGADARLLLRKTAENGKTLAAAERKWSVNFDEA